MGFRSWLLRHELKRILKGEDMQKLLALLAGKKTYLTAVAGLVVGLSGLAGVALPGGLMLSPEASLNMIQLALTGAFLRAGVAKLPGK